MSKTSFAIAIRRSLRVIAWNDAASPPPMSDLLYTKSILSALLTRLRRHFRHFGRPVFPASDDGGDCRRVLGRGCLSLKLVDHRRKPAAAPPRAFRVRFGLLVGFFRHFSRFFRFRTAVVSHLRPFLSYRSVKYARMRLSYPCGSPHRVQRSSHTPPRTAPPSDRHAPPMPDSRHPRR